MECQYEIAVLAVTLEGFIKYFLTLFEVAPLFFKFKVRSSSSFDLLVVTVL